MTILAKEELNQLVEGCRKGNRADQQKVYAHLYGKMLGVTKRYFSDEDEAKDILQEAFIKVFMNMHKFAGEGSFEGWVRRIVTNTSIDCIRKKKQIFHSIDADQYDWLPDQGDDEIKWNETLMNESERVMEALQRLAPSYRTVFSLYVIEGYSHQEVADMLEVTVGTTKSNLAKARMKLRKILGELHIVE